MWIIPARVLNAFSVSAQASEGWILDSESFTQLAARSLTWRGKDQQQPCWRRLLKRERWTRLLSGLTYEPSIAGCFVDMWMAWSAATHAKERASPGCNAELPTRDGCGQKSPELCAILSQLGASSRTSPTISIKDSVLLDQTWKNLATELRRRYSLRKKSGRRTGGNGCSLWPTAVAQDDNKSVEAHLAMKRRMGERDGTHANRTAITSLSVLVRQWPTPTANPDAKNAGANQKRTLVPPCLSEAAKNLNWTTPQAHDSQGQADAARYGRYGTKHGARNLNDHAAAVISQWSTPRASPNENRNTKAAPSHGNGHGRTLAGDAMSWATPQASDGDKGGPNSRDGSGSLHLASQSVLHGRQDLLMSPDGEELSLPEGWTCSRLYLNPRFVEWLMGWPDGLTSSGPVEMELYLYRQHTQLVCLLTSWTFIGDATC